MIRIITTLIISLITIFTSLFAQEINGTWYGKLKTPNGNIRINFNITKVENSYKTTMDSPDQRAFEIPTDKTNFKDNKVEIFLNNLLINYKGTCKNDSIKGTFTQNGMAFPLDLTKNKIVAENVKARPQDPIKPFPYSSKEVTFTNVNGDKIAGTLTLPKNVKNPKVVILISGSGPQDRNEEVKAFNHRPFLVLADYLTRNGIAVLRYDDRGVAKSKGKFKGATTLDFANDVESAVAYLKSMKNVHFSQIGLIGHSEGGLIAPIVASEDKAIDFIILLAGPGIDGGKILETQKEKISELSGLSKQQITANIKLTKEIHQIVRNAKNTNEVNQQLTDYFKNKQQISNSEKQQYIDAYSDNWLFNFVKINPQDYLAQVTCPVLVLNGSKDVQVLPKINLEAIQKATIQNKKVTLKEIQDVNHMFQTCNTGNINEYAKIEETISPNVLHIIADWIKIQ
ncbi:MAG TPA: alpha/beta fold hydrolase [Flavobacteriia bacterium]|nr:alpha/beta fold hydrolase [Flavobacteriia bacterium]